MSIKSRLALWAGALLSVLLGLHWLNKKRHGANYARSMHRLDEALAKQEEAEHVTLGLKQVAKAKADIAKDKADSLDKDLVALDAKIATRRERIDALLKKGGML